jgi:excisionase family DNA binding protein
MSKSRQKGPAAHPPRPPHGHDTRAAAPPPKGIEITINGIRIAVSPELEAAVNRAYKGLMSSLPPEMTTTQAAEFLDVSRPFVIKLTRRGELPYRLVGTHRRIPSTALLEYRERMFRRAKDAADEMTRTSQELGLYDSDEEPPTPR